MFIENAKQTIIKLKEIRDRITNVNYLKKLTNVNCASV